MEVILKDETQRSASASKQAERKRVSQANIAFIGVVRADARYLPLQPHSIDLIVTSPPYWRKRDYNLSGQIGQEAKPDEYVAALMTALQDWRRVLRPTGSVFLNIGDTWLNRSLTDIPGRIIAAARNQRWVIRNRIVWVKSTGAPDPAKNRLTSRHEYIVHMTVGHDYYYDLFGYAEKFGNGANPGDVWIVNPGRDTSSHPAPFPEEIAERIITLACPDKVCISCGRPRVRIVERTAQLDPTRPQARRAMEIAHQAGLTPAHIAAIQATGISDAGKALHIQTGAGRNSANVQKLAQEAKEALGGYFREFTFPRRATVGWTACKCRKAFRPGVILDPFIGTGTTLRVAARLNRSAIGIDLAPSVGFHIASNQR